jgi:hypothetical protein
MIKKHLDYVVPNFNMICEWWIKEDTVVVMAYKSREEEKPFLDAWPHELRFEPGML